MIEERECSADEHEIERRVGRHPVFAQAPAEEQRIHRGQPGQQVVEQRECRQRGDRAAEDGGNTLPRRRTARAQQPERARAGNEAQRREGVHGDAGGVEQALQELDIEEPAEQHRYSYDRDRRRRRCDHARQPQHECAVRPQPSPVALRGRGHGKRPRLSFASVTRAMPSMSAAERMSSCCRSARSTTRRNAPLSNLRSRLLISSSVHM